MTAPTNPRVGEILDNIYRGRYYPLLARIGDVGTSESKRIVDEALTSGRLSLEQVDAFRELLGEPDMYVMSLGDLVALAQQGWHYPLPDDDHTRAQIREWLRWRRDGPLQISDDGDRPG